MGLKWTIQELIKKAKNDNLIEERIDLRNLLRPEFEDLVDILETDVDGEYYYYQDENLFVFDLHIKTTLIMLCSITLEEVSVDLDFDSQLNFSVNYIDDDTHVIEGITIDLKPYVFSEILIEKPMKVIAKGASRKYNDESIELTNEEKEENNPFAKLKN
jgi:uncharacterized metal-binding protein YceD (DUF177 family)